MKKILVAVALVVAVAAPVFGENPWTYASSLLKRATVKITYDVDGNCTGVVIDKEKKILLAAGHCKPTDNAKGIYADGTTIRVVYHEANEDFLIFQAPDLDPKKTQIPLSETPVEDGDWIAAGGWGAGVWQFRLANVSNPKTNYDGIPGPVLMVNNPYVPGQSGGPVVNIKGELVGIVQRYSDFNGFGRDAEYIKDKVGRFFAKKDSGTAKP